MLELKNSLENIYNKYHWSGNGDYDFVGIRVQEIPFELGDIDHTSHVWINGEETDEELDGICVINIKELNNASHYFGNHVAIIVSDDAMCGEDLGELVMKNAKVVEILS